MSSRFGDSQNRLLLPPDRRTSDSNSRMDSGPLWEDGRLWSSARGLGTSYLLGGDATSVGTWGSNPNEFGRDPRSQNDRAKTSWFGAEIGLTSPDDRARSGWLGVEIGSTLEDRGRTSWFGVEIGVTYPRRPTFVIWIDDDWG